MRELGLRSRIEAYAIEVRHREVCVLIRGLPSQAAPMLERAGSAPLAHSVKIAELAKRQDISLGGLFLVGLMGIFNQSPEFNRCFNRFYIGFAIKRDAMGGIEKI